MNEINLPDPLPYPKLQPFASIPQLANLFCYVIKAYPQEGVGLTIVRKDDMVCARISDWCTGGLIAADVGQADKFINQIMTEICPRLVLTMKLIGVPQAQFFFTRDAIPRLVDIMLTQTKFCSPGFLQEFFGKQGLSIQEVVGNPTFMSPEEVGRITRKEGVYVFDKYIIKPSQFKFIVDGVKVKPMYAELSSEAKHAP